MKLAVREAVSHRLGLSSLDFTNRWLLNLLIWMTGRTGLDLLKINSEMFGGNVEDIARLFTNCLCLSKYKVSVEQ